MNLAQILTNIFFHFNLQQTINDFGSQLFFFINYLRYRERRVSEPKE